MHVPPGTHHSGLLVALRVHAGVLGERERGGPGRNRPETRVVDQLRAAHLVVVQRLHVPPVAGQGARQALDCIRRGGSGPHGAQEHDADTGLVLVPATHLAGGGVGVVIRGDRSVRVDVGVVDRPADVRGADLLAVIGDGRADVGVLVVGLGGRRGPAVVGAVEDALGVRRDKGSHPAGVPVDLDEGTVGVEPIRG